MKLPPLTTSSKPPAQQRTPRLLFALVIAAPLTAGLGLGRRSRTKRGSEHRGDDRRRPVVSGVSR